MSNGSQVRSTSNVNAAESTIEHEVNAWWWWWYGQDELAAGVRTKGELAVGVDEGGVCAYASRNIIIDSDPGNWDVLWHRLLHLAQEFEVTYEVLLQNELR